MFTVASKKAEVAGSPCGPSFRLHIGQFAVGLEGITTCAVALKLHLLYLPGNFEVLVLRNVPLTRLSPRKQ